MNNAPSTETPEKSEGRRSVQLLRTGLLIAGSAFLGGMAVVFWNQKSLTKLRQAAERGAENAEGGDEE